MLALTKKTDYALIALSHLARQSGSVVSAREIADRYHLPLPILTNILKTLAQASVLISERGASGGYGLAKPAESISLLELIATIEGPFQFVRCSLSAPETSQQPCDIESSCPIRLPAHRIRARLTEFLEHVTLAELMENDPALIGPAQTRPTGSAAPTAGELT